MFENQEFNLKAIDFFCSSGGVTCGFREAGIDVLGGIDIDSNCKETYERNNKNKFLCADISSLDVLKLQEEFNINIKQDNLIFIACSPCQYYTNIKTDKTKSKKTKSLLCSFEDFVDYYYPGYIFIENVPGFIKNPESPIEKFKKKLIKKNYRFIDEVLNAKDYGVPQNRRRYIMVATRLNVDISFPEKKTKCVTVKEAIGNYGCFPVIPAGYIDETNCNHSTSSLTEINLKRIKSIPHDGGDRKSWGNDESLQIKCYKDHLGHGDVYGRMFWDKPSPTITTRFNSFSNGRYGHPEQDRAISLREGATLQSFPYDYIFYSNNFGAIAKMIGNAVPPKLAKKIGINIKDSYIKFLDVNEAIQ